MAALPLLGPMELWRRHQQLPRWLRVQWLAPITLLVAVAGGGLLTLPPGPLCDEGMVLFMEGGCDWGASNIFFFAKAALLIVLTGALLFAARRKVSDLAAFVPHFVIAAALVVIFRSGGRCDTYYVHPNGSIGQMVAELAAFALLGLVALEWAAGRSWPQLLGGALAWHGLHVVAFYGWLEVWDHWLWMHTAAVAVSLVTVALVLRSALRR